MQTSQVMRQRWAQKTGKTPRVPTHWHTQTQPVGSPCWTKPARSPRLAIRARQAMELLKRHVRCCAAAGKRSPLVVKMVPMGASLLLHAMSPDSEPQCAELPVDEYVDEASSTNGACLHAPGCHVAMQSSSLRLEAGTRACSKRNVLFWHKMQMWRRASRACPTSFPSCDAPCRQRRLTKRLPPPPLPLALPPDRALQPQLQERSPMATMKPWQMTTSTHWLKVSHPAVPQRLASPLSLAWFVKSFTCCASQPLPAGCPRTTSQAWARQT
jgi:hypothetical protein